MLDVGGGCVRVPALMDTVPSVKLESFGQWGTQVNTAKYTNSCHSTRFDLVAPFINCANINSQQWCWLWVTKERELLFSLLLKLLSFNSCSSILEVTDKTSIKHFHNFFSSKPAPLCWVFRKVKITNWYNPVLPKLLAEGWWPKFYLFCYKGPFFEVSGIGNANICWSKNYAKANDNIGVEPVWPFCNIWWQEN